MMSVLKSRMSAAGPMAVKANVLMEKADLSGKYFLMIFPLVAQHIQPNTTKPAYRVPLLLKDAVGAISIVAPIRPINTPASLCQVPFIWKNQIPMSKVNSGVRELRIPVVELEMWVCAMAQQKAGNPLPVKATSNSKPHSRRLTPRHSFQKKGAKAIAAKLKRRLATCMGERATKAFLMRIKELPHTMERRTKRSQLDLGVGNVSIFYE